VSIINAIEEQDAARFLELLDLGFRQAAKAASDESHALGLHVADGRCDEPPKGGESRSHFEHPVSHREVSASLQRDQASRAPGR
jgi:hypothetical protein